MTEKKGVLNAMTTEEFIAFIKRRAEHRGVNRWKVPHESVGPNLTGTWMEVEGFWHDPEDAK